MLYWFTTKQKTADVFDRGARRSVLAAVKSDGFALQFAAEELREDRELKLAAEGWS